MHTARQEISSTARSSSPRWTVEQSRSPSSEPDSVAHSHPPLVRMISQAGRPASASVHASLLNRASGNSPTQRRQLLLQLQQQYGNRYVQRVVALFRQAEGEAQDATPEVETAIDLARGQGQSLDRSVQRQMESAFGTSFTGVRVHTDSRADTLNQVLSARAFTTGQDIFFRQGEYDPGSASGRELLAHELTHVVQQTGGTQAKLQIGQPHDLYEQEADQVARTVMMWEQQISAGGEAESPIHPMVGVGSDRAPQVQGQFVTPLGPGGGFGGLLERGRTALTPMPVPPAAAGLTTVKVWLNAFIPMPHVGTGIVYSGDGRGFSNAIHAPSRTHQEIEFEAATLRKTIDYKHIGTSHLLNPVTFSVITSATASTSTVNNGSVLPFGSEIAVDFQIDSANPLAPGAPAINADVVFHIDPARRTCRLSGMHDGFPAYEAYVTANGGAGTTVYTYDPRTVGEDPSALFPPMDKTVSGTAVSF